MFDKEYIDKHYTYKLVPLLILKDLNREAVTRELVSIINEIAVKFGEVTACEVMDYWTSKFNLKVKGA